MEINERMPFDPPGHRRSGCRSGTPRDDMNTLPLAAEIGQ
jgi:hypothetical protein